MSHYPPPSTFGTSFSPNEHLKLSASNRHQGPPQYPYPYQDLSFLYSQGQTNGKPIAPHPESNSQPFYSNSQGVVSPKTGNEINGAPRAPYDGQVHAGTFQTSAYSPTTFAHEVPSYRARPFSPVSANSNLPSNSSDFFPRVHPAAEVQSTNVGASDTAAPPLSDLEDGELDDEDVGKAIDQSGANMTTPLGLSQNKRHESVGSADSGSKQYAANIPIKPLPGLNPDSLATRNRRGFTTSQSQRHSISNGSAGNSDDPQVSRTAESTSVQSQLSTNNSKQGSQEANQQFIDQKMEEAKQALRDLHSQGFDFNQIVKAGLDPIILRNLYNKIEVFVAASSDLPQRKFITPGLVESPAEGSHDRYPQSPQRASNDDALENDSLPHVVIEDVKLNSQLSLAAAKAEGKSLQSQADVAKSSKSSNVNPLGKASGIKAGGTKILDRKEYIARMLAAKVAKPAVSARVPISSHTSTTENGKYAQARPSPTDAATVSSTGLQATSDLDDTALGTQKGDLDVEAKRKAQTDLARQKMEALKHRENFQQQARSATRTDAISDIRQSPAKIIPVLPTENPVSTPLPVTGRQSSYFSPASQKPPFSIPGLFMTSDALEPANPSKAIANEDIAVSSQIIGDASKGSSEGGLRPHTAISAQSLGADEISSLPETSASNTASCGTITTIASSNRKRQRASDFIDSPSTKVKRPLGQQEEISIIIDISDDEISNDTSGDDPQDGAGRQDALSRDSQVNVPNNGVKNPIKSLPPPIDLPQRKKLVMMTPPAAQALGHDGDLKGLKSKEMEIEVMNRKIAELEQRIATKAKQTTSRNQSPGTSSHVTISSSPGEALNQVNTSPNIPLSVSDLQNGDDARVKTGESFTAHTETNEAIVADQLNAKQQLDEVERAKAEAQRSLAAEISLASAAHQSVTRQEKIQIPQAQEPSNVREGEQRPEDEEQDRVQGENERHLDEHQDRQALGEEIKTSHQEEADRFLQEQEQKLAQGAQHKHLQEQQRKRSLDDQRQARKSELESGLPLLDAEIERTRIKLESLRQELAGLEKQLQKGVEGRQGLIEELHMLLRSSEALPEPMDLDSSDFNAVPKQSTNTEEKSTVTNPSASVETVSNQNPIELSSTVESGREVREKDYSVRCSEERMSDGEYEEDNMDISRSDIDEAEFSHYSPKAATKIQDTSSSVDDDNDDDENYEPPNDISIARREKPDPDAVLLPQDLETAKTESTALTQDQPSTNLDAEPIEKTNLVVPSPAASIDMAGNERSLSRSPSLANASDPDEYEPPEPAPLGEEIPRSTYTSSVDSEASFSSRDVDTTNSVAHASPDLLPAVPQQIQNLEPDRKMGLFTPYDSPLKQFKSFRYHPRYLEEVSSGFRSLTYSHTINPDLPLCRYELDGVCNDDSCQSQHLRSVGLSDDKILVDLGAKPDDGSSSDDFGNGLREVIHNIRSRKIRDFNIVAGEITAYRAKFLGDSSKVLPL